MLTCISSISAARHMAEDDADEMASWNTCTEDGPFTSTAAAAAESGRSSGCLASKLLKSMLRRSRNTSLMMTRAPYREPSELSRRLSPPAATPSLRRAEATTTSSPTSAARRTNATKITAESAVEIFKAGGLGAKRSGVSKVLAERYGITMKAVRDIWNLRTWTQVTMPLRSSEGPTMTIPGDEMHEGMADATAAASASCTSSALGHHALCYEAERVAGRSSVTGLGQQTFDKKTQSLSVLSVGSASSPTERTESDCFDFNTDFEAVSSLIRSVPDNPCAYWSTGSVMEPEAYAAHALDCVAPAAPVAESVSEPGAYVCKWPCLLCICHRIRLWGAYHRMVSLVREMVTPRWQQSDPRLTPKVLPSRPTR